jgi:hypothetical protein
MASPSLRTQLVMLQVGAIVLSVADDQIIS